MRAGPDLSGRVATCTRLGLAAHVPGVAAIEANARQYVPAASRGWDERLPALFRIRDGTADTSGLTGPGLGAVS